MPITKLTMNNMTEKCDVCKKGRISYSKWKKAKDEGGKEYEYQDVKCSTETCIINGIEL